MIKIYNIDQNTYAYKANFLGALVLTPYQIKKGERFIECKPSFWGLDIPCPLYFKSIDTGIKIAIDEFIYSLKKYQGQNIVNINLEQTFEHASLLKRHQKLAKRS